MDLLDLHSLTPEERNIIMAVLRRDEELRRRQDNRISQVKQEIHSLRMSSVLRSGDDLSKMCARCKAPFGRVTNTGEVCPVCHFRVCKSCRESLLTKGWLCTLCSKENQLRWLTGEWMGKGSAEKSQTSRFNSGTDLLRASLRVKHPNGTLGGGAEGAAGPGASRGGKAGQEGAGPHHSSSSSQDKTPLSNLFHSIRTGLGGASEDQADTSGAGGAVGGSGGAVGGSVVVQHVSCRRRHDSNSDSDSDSDSQGHKGLGVRKQQASKTNGSAVEVRDTADPQHKGRAQQDSAATKTLDSRSGELDGRGSSNNSSLPPDTAAVKERQQGGRRGGEGPCEAKARSGNTGRRSELPQRVRGGESQARREGGLAAAQGVAQQEEERPASGCSFTSSEWGDVTPTENSPGFGAPAPQDRKEDVQSTPGQSSGYMSTSRKSLEVLDTNALTDTHHYHQHSNHDSPSPSSSFKPKTTSPSKVPVRSRQLSRESSQMEEPATPPATKPPPPDTRSSAIPQPAHRSKGGTGTQGHVRRQSSGRSETLSTCSAKTASPATKMRLLDLASSRALDREEEGEGGSVRSWSGGSEDTMSLGMSCSGLPVSADTPVFQKVQHKRPKGCEERQAGRNEGRTGVEVSGLERETQVGKEDVITMDTNHSASAATYTDPAKDSRHSPQHLSDGERGGGGGGGATSDQSSDTGHGSPSRGRPMSRSGSTPRKSNLSIPSVVATSHSGGSNDERSVEDDDDIDELFAKYRSHSQLGVSRSTIGDSRESLASVYSDAGEINYGRIPVSGEITFGLEFDPKLSALRIHIKGCKDLAAVNVKRNSSDPYVKVYLLPDKTRSGKQKSKIKKHTLNPVYNETLTYHISQGELENRTLWVTVWHNDRLGRNDFLGEVLIPMDTYRFGDPTPCTYTLQARTPDTVNEESMQYKGDLLVALKYVTPDQVTEGKKSKSKSKKSKSAPGGLGEIHAKVKSACNLTAARSNGMSDPFVKGYLLPDRGKTSKQKTGVVKNSVNPTWDDTLVFEGVDAMEMAERCLELTVWDHETLGTNQFLGGARLNLGLGSVKGAQVEWMDARGQESILWQGMMERPNSWVEARLPLRANMGKAGTRK
ncbi:uncharacterized protein LOC143282778 [Babylonia areolata]|uniref:uncharacterized protein LOC143282778 n=1 Tax=Babylonia areolata TaxID=304850 RepID=UPI003FD275AE